MTTLSMSQWIGVAVWAGMTAMASAEPTIMRDPATHEQLVLALRKAEQNDPMKNMAVVAKGEDSSVANQPPSLLSQSDIISFGGLATLVPKRAILQIPRSCTERMKIEAGAKLVSWAEFYTANRGWITTIEISRVQAEGNRPLADETRKYMSKCRNLIVATYQGGPISLLPAKLPAPPSIQPATTPQ